MWPDILTALAVLPFAVLAAFGVFIFLEWSKEDNTYEAHLLKRLVRIGKEYEGSPDRPGDGGGGGLSRRVAMDAFGEFLDGKERG